MKRAVVSCDKIKPNLPFMPHPSGKVLTISSTSFSSIIDTDEAGLIWLDSEDVESLE